MRRHHRNRPNRAERRRAKRLHRLAGPVSYQVELFRLRDVLAGAAVGGAFGRAALASESVKVLDAAVGLAGRMRDRSRPTMLCAFCEHTFAHDEPPVEILVALPFANENHPAITSAVCASCASAEWTVKRSKIVASFKQLLGPDTWVADQAGAA